MLSYPSNTAGSSRIRKKYIHSRSSIAFNSHREHPEQSAKYKKNGRRVVITARANRWRRSRRARYNYKEWHHILDREWALLEVAFFGGNHVFLAWRETKKAIFVPCPCRTTFRSEIAVVVDRYRSTLHHCSLCDAICDFVAIPRNTQSDGSRTMQLTVTFLHLSWEAVSGGTSCSRKQNVKFHWRNQSCKMLIVIIMIIIAVCMLLTVRKLNSSSPLPFKEFQFKIFRILFESIREPQSNNNCIRKFYTNLDLVIQFPVKPKQLSALSLSLKFKYQ